MRGIGVALVVLGFVGLIAGVLMIAPVALAQSSLSLEDALKKETASTRTFLGDTMRFCKEAAAPSLAQQNGAACEDKLAMAQAMASTDPVRAELKALDKLRTNILIMAFGSAKGGIAAAAAATQGYDRFLSAMDAASQTEKLKKKR